MKGPRRPKRATFACPHCGAEVKAGAAACRECGSDAGTGWQSSEEIDYQSLDLPEGYSTDPEHPGGSMPKSRARFWVALVLLVAIAVLLLVPVLMLLRLR